MKVGVIGAMDTEIRLLVKNLQNVMESDEKFLHFYEGNFGKTPVVIVKSGVGKVNAAICTQSLITKFGCTHIINSGVAGGIAKELAVMDTVVSTDAIFHDVNATLAGPGGPQIFQNGLFCLGVYRGYRVIQNQDRRVL